MFCVRCHTCGKVVGNKLNEYSTLIRTMEPQDALDQMGFDRYCCRSRFLTYNGALEQVMWFERDSPFNKNKHLKEKKKTVGSRILQAR